MALEHPVAPAAMPVFSSRTIRPAPRHANCQAILAPEQPPPTTTTSATSATHENPTVSAEWRRVFADVATQTVVLRGRWLFEKPASTDRWQARSGQVSPHLGQLEPRQHAIDEWCTRCPRGVTTGVGQDGAGQRTPGYERLRAILLDAPPRGFNNAPDHRVRWRPFRVQIVSIDVKRSHRRQLAAQSIDVEQHLLNLAILVVNGEQREAAAHLIREQRRGFERGGDGNRKQLAALVQSDVELTREEDRVVPLTLRLQGTLDRAIDALMSEVQPLVVLERVDVADVDNLEVRVRTRNSRKVVTSMDFGPAEWIDNQNPHRRRSFLLFLDSHPVDVARSLARDQACLHVIAHAPLIAIVRVSPATTARRHGQQPIALLQEGRDLAGQLGCGSVGMRDHTTRTRCI